MGGVRAPGQKRSLDASQRGRRPTIHLPQPNSPRRGPLKKRLVILTELEHARLEGGSPSPVTPRGTVTGTRVYPQLRHRIDCQRPTIHRLLRRGTASGKSNRLRMPRQNGPRVSKSDSRGQNQRDLNQMPPPSRQRDGSIGRRGSINRSCQYGT